MTIQPRDPGTTSGEHAQAMLEAARVFLDTIPTLTPGHLRREHPGDPLMAELDDAMDAVIAERAGVPSLRARGGAR